MKRLNDIQAAIYLTMAFALCWDIHGPGNAGIMANLFMALFYSIKVLRDQS
jgi:hypothetical protein